MKRFPTLRDIAQEAGVSIATVSMVINKKADRISEPTQARVLKAAKRLGYIHNAMAASLVTRRTKTIGFVVPDITNPFFPEIAKGVEDMAQSNGFHVMICNTGENPKREEQCVRGFLEKAVDGILLTHGNGQNDLVESLHNGHVPVVLIDRNLDSPLIDGRIMVDNEAGGYLATQHLIDQGCRRIVFLGGPKSSVTNRAREAGYRKALEEAGLSSVDVLYGDYCVQSGENMGLNVLKNGITFDGAFCANDAIAIGAMQEWSKVGIQVPEDVLLIGFDDISLARYMHPSLSTIHQPKHRMGSMACRMLLDCIEGVESKREIVLKASLVVRESTKKVSE